MKNDASERFIRKNYIFGERFKKIIDNETDLQQKLILIKFLASFYTINVCGKYSDYFIENILNTVGRSLVITDVIENKNSVLHVASEVYETGGHTRVIHNWIKCDVKHKHNLLITCKRCIVPLWLQEAVRDSGGKIIILTEDNPIKCAQELVDIAVAFEKIVLHIHHDDIVPVIAFSASIKNPIYFYNHADNLFWLGVSIGDLFLELSENGKEMSLKKRGVIFSEVLSIPIKPIVDIIEERIVDKSKKNDLLKSMGFSENNKLIVSMASDYKFTSESPYDFLKFSRLIVKKYPNTTFMLIGPKSKRWESNKLMSNGNVIAVGSKTKEEVAQILPLADVYVDSFLFSSSTALIEAVSCHIPCVSLRTCFHSPDALNCIQSTTQEEMVEKVGIYLKGKKYFNFEEVLGKLKQSNFYSGWNETLKRIYSIPLTHKLKKFEDSDIIIEEYEKLSCILINKKRKYIPIYKINLPIKDFNKLTFKNFFKTLILLFSLHPLNMLHYLPKILSKRIFLKTN